MAAPEYVPVPVTEKARLPWESPDHVPPAWTLDRPAEVGQGRAADRAPPRLPGPRHRLRPHAGGADPRRGGGAARGAASTTPSSGCTAIAMRRAALFGRAPVMHDLRLAFTIWGWFDAAPSEDLRCDPAVGVRGGQPRLRDPPGGGRPGARGDAADDAGRGDRGLPGPLAGAHRQLTSASPRRRCSVAGTTGPARRGGRWPPRSAARSAAVRRGGGGGWSGDAGGDRRGAGGARRCQRAEAGRRARRRRRARAAAAPCRRRPRVRQERPAPTITMASAGDDGEHDQPACCCCRRHRSRRRCPWPWPSGRRSRRASAPTSPSCRPWCRWSR